MMGPEAMGIKQQNYDWWDEKVCRNFLFGTCPHLVFGNTVSQVSHSASEASWTACFTRLRK
jgi:RNA-binding protein Luc7-like 2